MRAARSSDTGTCRKKLRRSHTMSGSQNAVLTMTSAWTVSVRPRIWKIRRTGMAMTMPGTIWVNTSTPTMNPASGSLKRASE
jgi:hypothetical protein